MYSRVLIIVACLAAFGLGYLAYRSVSDRETPKVDARLGEVVLDDLDGTSHRLSEWSKSILVVNFWATWCPPCKEEMPEFVTLQRELQARGVQFVGIAIDDPADVRAYLQASPVNYPILIGEPGGTEWAARLGNVMQVLPFTALVDRAGQVSSVKTGAYTRQELRDRLEELLDHGQ